MAVSTAAGDRLRPLPLWPLILIALPAAVAVWSGWVGLGTLCGFGIVHPLPGIWDSLRLNTAITLPVGVEAYGAYALAAWLHPGTVAHVKRFARNSALGSLALGMGGQVIYHLLAAWHRTAAPWPVVMLVSCLPVVTLGFGTALTHLLRTGTGTSTPSFDDPHPADAELAPVADAPGTAVTETAGVPAIEADSTPDNTPPIPADTQQDTGADTAQPPVRTLSPTPRPRAKRTARPDNAARIARLRTKNPDLTNAEIASRLGIHPRTVRRHSNGPSENRPTAA